MSFFTGQPTNPNAHIIAGEPRHGYGTEVDVTWHRGWHTFEFLAGTTTTEAAAPFGVFERACPELSRCAFVRQRQELFFRTFGAC